MGVMVGRDGPAGVGVEEDASISDREGNEFELR